jgi:hypothetical protein
MLKWYGLCENGVLLSIKAFGALGGVPLISDFRLGCTDYSRTYDVVVVQPIITEVCERAM